MVFRPLRLHTRSTNTRIHDKVVLMRSILFPISIVLFAASTAWAQADTEGRLIAYRNTVAPLVERFCVSCHGKKQPKAGLSLQKLPGDPRTPADLTTWKKVYGQLQSSAMPPEDSAQPPLESRLRAMDWIRQTLKAAGTPVDLNTTRILQRCSVRKCSARGSRVLC